MLRTSLCDIAMYTYLLKGKTITVAKETDATINNANTKVIFKNFAPFTSCISRTNNTQVDDAQYINVVMSMYNLTEYSNNYSKTSVILWQYCRDEPASADDNTINDFTEAYTITSSFKIKEKISKQFLENSWNPSK